MSRGPVVLLAWAALLAAIAAVEWTLFPIGGPAGWLLVALPAFAVAATLAFALADARRRRARGDGLRRAPWLSPPSALVGIALATVALGLAVGQWLWLIGLGLLAAGVAGLVRERRA